MQQGLRTLCQCGIKHSFLALTFPRHEFHPQSQTIDPSIIQPSVARRDGIQPRPRPRPQRPKEQEARACEREQNQLPGCTAVTAPLFTTTKLRSVEGLLK